MTLPGQLIEEIEALRKNGHVIDLIEAEGWANLVFENYLVPLGYSRSSTKLLVKAPLSYPNGHPDMFWTDTELTCKDGQTPRSAEVIESALGRQWRRFSWHFPSQSWNPAVGNIQTYLEFINRRLRQAV